MSRVYTCSACHAAGHNARSCGITPEQRRDARRGGTPRSERALTSVAESGRRRIAQPYKLAKVTRLKRAATIVRVVSSWDVRH